MTFFYLLLKLKIQVFADASTKIKFRIVANIGAALMEPDTHLRLFGKPEMNGRRRLGVVACLGESNEAAREKARRAAAQVNVRM